MCTSTNDDLPQPSQHLPVYQFYLQTHIDLYWSDWFEGMTIHHVADGMTVLSGEVADQSALHGLLNKIRDLGLTLVALRQIPAVYNSEVGGDQNRKDSGCLDGRSFQDFVHPET